VTGSRTTDVEPLSGEGDEVVPLAEETLHVGKRRVETGRVRVSLTTETVEQVVRETLRTRRTDIVRVPVGREVTEVPKTRQEGDVLVVPVVEEILVVEKRLVLKEEIRLHLVDTEQTVELPTERRLQHATVERMLPEPGAPEETPDKPSHQQGTGS
jgi:stress response protein YsnF